jgi:hypothetical protein
MPSTGRKNSVYVWVGMVLPEVTQRAKPTTRKWSDFRQCPVVFYLKYCNCSGLPAALAALEFSRGFMALEN